MLVAGFDVVLAGLLMPAVHSRLTGVVQLWCHMTLLYWLCTLPASFLLAYLATGRLVRRLPHPAVLLGQLALGTGGAVAIGAADRLLDVPLEFEGELNLVRWAVTAVLAALLVLVATAVQPTLIRAGRGIRRTSVWWTAELGALGVVLSAFGWAVLCPVGQFAAASLVGVGSVIMAALALGAVVDGRSVGWRIAATALVPIVVLGATWPGPGLYHARWVLFFRGGPHTVIAWRFRALLDRDGDASASLWVGGADCAEGDAAIGPAVREIPGDRIDQDCRGGDAPLATVPPSGGLLPMDCSPALQAPSVLLVTIDSLRADHLTPELTPNLLALARGSWAFARAYSPTSRTASSMPALMSGRKLSDVGGPNPVVSDALQVSETLAEAFVARGYRTAVFHDLDFNPFTLRGFQERNPYWRDPPIPHAKEDLTTATMARGYLEYLARSAQPSFVLLHLADIHAPYGLLGDLAAGRTESEAYALAVQYTDRQLGHLLLRLQGEGRLEQLVLAVTADHGEELRAHGLHGHPESAMEEVIQVPLLVRVPGCRPSLVLEPVSTCQLAPTLAAAVGVPYPGRGLFVRDQMPVVAEAATSSDISHHRAVFLGSMKLIVDAPNGGRVLFDLDADPAETQNLYGLDTQITERMESAYQRWLDSPGAR